MFPAGLELSMQLRMTEFPILLPSPPVFWAYKCTPPHQVYAMLGTEPSFLLRPFLYQPRPRQRQPPFLPLYSLSLMMSGSPEGDRLVKAEGGVRGLHCPEVCRRRQACSLLRDPHGEGRGSPFPTASIMYLLEP